MPSADLEYKAFGSRRIFCKATNEQVMANPFPLPATLHPDLARVRDYWESLKRGENKVPFADDVGLSGLGALQGKLVLLDAFDKPLRFRFGIVGADVRGWYGGYLVDKFADELMAKGPLAYFVSQASATAEALEATYYQNDIQRLLLPLWGGGYVSGLLGCILR